MRLKDKRAAVLLTAGLLAVPLLPAVLVGATPIDDWAPVGAGEPVRVVSADGAAVDIELPAGWVYRQFGGDGVVARSADGAAVLLEVVDRDGRDPDAVTERLIRRDRVGGTNAALTEGAVSTGDGSLHGRPCTAVAHELSGSCAFLADDDVVVSVYVLGTPDTPAPDLSDVLGAISRSDS
ncbi:hypothetical protein [uncultured Mycolicibacterium sp.]|uniref:hypothetical protein n=1 Tax=uncultured Mycolicibacterium sp. TaxID=2320817 RepID=UPI002609F668|nr:hypothetical protein [uncultured Mycolicibacterium sp.]